MMYGYFKEVKTMIDKNDPEIQAYLKEELQKQKEQITERILWRNAKSLLGGPT